MINRILLADDHPLVRQAIRLVLASKWSGYEIDEASTLQQAHDMCSRSKYKLIILDLMLPDTSGFSGLVLLRSLAAGTPIAIISSRTDAQTAASAYKLGAVAYVAKSVPLSQMIDMFEGAMNARGCGRPAENSDLTPELHEISDQLATLTTAELRTLFALADGNLNKQIAADMLVSEATVKAHLTKVFRKLGVETRTQAILAIQSVLQFENPSPSAGSATLPTPSPLG